MRTVSATSNESMLWSNGIRQDLKLIMISYCDLKFFIFHMQVQFHAPSFANGHTLLILRCENNVKSTYIGTQFSSASKIACAKERCEIYKVKSCMESSVIIVSTAIKKQSSRSATVHAVMERLPEVLMVCSWSFVAPDPFKPHKTEQYTIDYFVKDGDRLKSWNFAGTVDVYR